MSEEQIAISSPENIVDVEARFARNIGAEGVTILIHIVFGIISSVLIVRGLPQTPVYEFYVYIVVFTWVNVLVPVGIMGLDVALMKHLPELTGSRASALYRIIALSGAASLIVSLGVLFGINWLLVWLPSGSLVPIYVTPYFQLALLTVPLVAISTVFQGVFRGMQQMRYCAQAMGLFHGLFVFGLAFQFFTGSLTILMVIFTNIAASVGTIIFEIVILARLLRKYQQNSVKAKLPVLSQSIAGTAVQAFVLALLGAVFLNIPLLIANIFRTSDVIFGGLGLALGVAFYLHQGQAAPFRVLVPRVSGDIKQEAWETVKGYLRRAWKLGILFAGFVTLIVLFFASPVMFVFFASEGMVATPFLVLMAGSFLVYPLASMLMDTLIGLGNIRTVLLTFAVWNGLNAILLWVLSPLIGEMIAALIWLAGIPFLLLFVILFQQRTGIRMSLQFLPRFLGVLLGIGIVSVFILWAGGGAIGFWGLVGSTAWLLQVGLLLTVVPVSALYVWSLIRIRVLDAIDVRTLVQIIEVLDPISRPVTWLLRRMTR
jgi:O-antigen/teichoic acid export membrane protein